MDTGFTCSYSHSPHERRSGTNEILYIETLAARASDGCRTYTLQCYLCNDPMQKQQIQNGELYYTKCAHVFHKACYKNRAKEQKAKKTSCPYCSTEEFVDKKIIKGKQEYLSKKVKECLFNPPKSFPKECSREEEEKLQNPPSKVKDFSQLDEKTLQQVDADDKEISELTDALFNTPVAPAYEPATQSNWNQLFTEVEDEELQKALALSLGETPQDNGNWGYF